MSLGKIETEAVNATLETEKGLENNFVEEEPESLIDRPQTYGQGQLNDIILLIILISLTVFNFFVESKVVSLNFFYLVILLSGYILDKRAAVLLAFLTVLIVWAFILSDKNPYLIHLSDYELNFHMTLWSGLLILTGWFGSFLAKTFSKSRVEEPQI
jgi:K+-sensing histidine kinase KdpD